MICTVAVALCFAAILGHFERNPAEVERLASDCIELSTRQNFAHWFWLEERFFAVGRAALPVTPRKASQWIEDGIRDCRATGAMRSACHIFWH